jgi:LemA protein
MKAGGWIALVIVIIVAVSAIAWYINGLNRAVRLHEAVNASWAQVETQLQRRYDLIPNLVSTVKGYAAHEEEVFSEITRLRSQWASAQTREAKIENAQAMEGMLARLMVVAENYPDLKASENFRTLQAQLEGTENRISVERKRYNDAVRAFNTYQREVMGGFFTRRKGLTEPAVYFEAAPQAKEAPRVEF